MLTSRYMANVKNLPAILKKITEGTAPSKFTTSHLKGIGFKSSNDLGAIPLLKDLKFLAPDGTPTQRYHDYRDQSKSRAVLGEALKEAYEDLFFIDENLSEKDRAAITGKFKTTHNVKDPVADHQTRTFLALLKLADLEHKTAPLKNPKQQLSGKDKDEVSKHVPMPAGALGGFHYNIEIHLPASKDIEVFNAIFKSLREHLIS